MSSILYYITGHGFGHAVRSHQVIRALRKARPELRVCVRTTAPAWLFGNPPGAVDHFPQAIDVGILQKDSLDMDLERTVGACRELIADAPAIIEREIAFVKAQQIRLILGDIPPLCFEVAARAGLPSIAISNFTWDMIYQAYLSAYPSFRPAIEQMTEWYSKATLALVLPYPCAMGMFPSSQPIPWIARVSPLTRSQARAKFALPASAKIVLISFGGLGLECLPWDRVSQSSDFFFVSTGHRPARSGNVAILPDTQTHYEDLIRAADAIVTKPGYGIVADAIAQRVPILYTERGDFAEYPRLVEALRDCATAEYITQTELLAGHMEPHIRRLLAKDAHWPKVRLDGAQAAAETVLALIDEYS